MQLSRDKCKAKPFKKKGEKNVDRKIFFKIL